MSKRLFIVEKLKKGILLRQVYRNKKELNKGVMEIYLDEGDLIELPLKGIEDIKRFN